jgi:hypothetical protein
LQMDTVCVGGGEGEGGEEERIRVRGNGREHNEGWGNYLGIK